MASILVLLYAKDSVLAALAKGRDAVLLAGDFVTELKVEFPALYALVASKGNGAAPTK